MIHSPPLAPDHRYRTRACGTVALASTFQPIYSFSHRRLVGHEALLRTSDHEGRSIAPPQLFDACGDVTERRALDHAARVVHASRFARQCEPAQWLFVNVDPSSCDPRVEGPDSIAPLLESVCGSGLAPHQVVIELLEAALPDNIVFEQWTGALKAAGFLIALDDFGAGYSNLDRVFRLRPQIVKLDRSVIVRAEADRTIRRVLAQMIALLHECGAQVLVEGVETADEASLALDSDADFVQGYYFGRPSPILRRSSEPCAPMTTVWESSDERVSRERVERAARIEPYRRAMVQAKSLLEAGSPMSEAGRAFVALEHADLCYLLDERGALIAHSVVHRKPAAHAAIDDSPFAPLLDVREARWSRRPYFRTAVAAPGRLQVTRPYPTMHSPLLSVTLSIALSIDGDVRVLCGDKLWRSDGQPIDADVVEPSKARPVCGAGTRPPITEWIEQGFIASDTITIG